MGDAPILLNAEQRVVFLAVHRACRSAVGPFARPYTVSAETAYTQMTRTARGSLRPPYGEAKTRRLLKQLDSLGAVLQERDFGGFRYRLSYEGKLLLDSWRRGDDDAR